MSVTLAVVTLVAGILFASPFTAWAEELASELPNRFMIRGAYGFVFQADTVFSFNGSHGIGGTVDFDQTLGGERSDDFWRIDASFHITPRHALVFSYYDVSRTGERTLDRDVVINDTTFATNSRVDSELDIALYRLYYNYSLYLSEKVDLALSVGLYVGDIKFKISGDLACSGGTTSCVGQTLAASSTDEHITVPLPSLGFQVNYNFLPRLQAQLRFDWFHLQFGDVKGFMTEVYLGAEYRIFKHFALGAAYDFLYISAGVDSSDKGGWNVTNSWNTVFAYAALYF
jgi:hypothetical protein